MTEYKHKDAHISICGRYRYSLTRRWEWGGKLAVIIGLNPSTADADADDHTIRKEVGLCQRHGLSGFVKLNLFAYRSTDQLGLLRAADPVGPINDSVIRVALEAPMVECVILAWGSGKSAGVRHLMDARVCKLLNSGVLGSHKVGCWGTSREGRPRHPLMLGWGTQLEPFAFGHSGLM